MSNASRELLTRMFTAALEAIRPAGCLPRFLPAPPPGRTFVVGAGKAAAVMAQALERHWPGELSGIVTTCYGSAVPCTRIRVVEAAHPVPDGAGRAAAGRMLDLGRNLTADDLVIGLFSSGATALLPLPGDTVTLQEKQALSRALAAAGASAAEISCVRRHLSAVKGGRLAAAFHPARVVNLLVSDVPGDCLEMIADGPTVADPTTSADALAILERHGVELPTGPRWWLESREGETPKPGDPRLARVETHVIASARLALAAAAEVARAAGVTPLILSDGIDGEARQVARVLAAIARQAAHDGQLAAPPCVLLSGGEARVTVTGDGYGGRNAEFLLALALALEGAPDIHALAADTDGLDGGAPVAGAVIGPDTLARARALGLRPHEHLLANDSHTFFEALGDGLVTGPQPGGVNDFRAVLVGMPPG